MPNINMPYCSICRDPFTPDCIIISTDCGHIFHRECIVSWLKTSPNCPECRKCDTELNRVFLNFMNNTEAEEKIPISPDYEQKNKELMMKLQLEEVKIQSLSQQIQELEGKLFHQKKMAKAKNEEFAKMLLSVKLKADLTMEYAMKYWHAAEESEKSVEEEMYAHKKITRPYGNTSAGLKHRANLSNHDFEKLLLRTNAASTSLGAQSYSISSTSTSTHSKSVTASTSRSVGTESCNRKN